jgi:drug/metabolite transporter (DMT)-like permease
MNLFKRGAQLYLTCSDRVRLPVVDIVGVVLGLGAALSWGLADYFAALASRGIGALRVVLGFHLFALIPLTVLVLATGALTKVTSHELMFYLAIGVVGWISYLAFYGALAIGPISVLSPIVSGYAAVTVLLAVLFADNVLTGLQVVAVALTIAGAMLASADLRAIGQTRFQRRSVLGFLLALCAMALLGGFVFGVSYYRPQLGWLAPIFLARAFATVFLLGHVLAGGRARRPAEEQAMPEIDAVTAGAGPLAAGAVSVPEGARTLGWGTLLGLLALLALLDTGGYVSFNLGVGHSSAAIVAAASAPYAVVPIIMGVTLFKERPTPLQWAGVACVIIGVIVLGAVS